MRKSGYRSLYIASITILLLFTICCTRKVHNAKESEQCFEKHLLSPSQREAIRKEIHADEKAFALDTLFQKKHNRQGFNGAVLVMQKGVIIYKNAFGYSNFADKTPLDLNSAFQLASISKTFTAVAALLLVQEGKISLSDSIQQFIPAFPYHGITIQDLLSHRSGLPNYLYAFEDKRKLKGAPPSNDSIIDWFCKADPLPPAYNKPGCFFSYNNSNFVILASIIEKASGLKYAEFMTQRIFHPLRMNHTFIDTIAPDSLIRLKTCGYNGYHRRERDFYDGVYGDKGVFSTVQDMANWYIGISNECILNRHWLKQAFTPRSFEKKSRHNYGLGFRLITFEGDMKKVEYIYHGGWWAGYSTMFWTSPKDEFAIIILSNKKSSSAYEVRPVIKIMEGGKETDSEANGDSSDTL